MEHAFAFGIDIGAVVVGADVHDGVPTQAVDFVFVEPHAHLVGDEVAHFGPSEVRARTPWRVGPVVFVKVNPAGVGVARGAVELPRGHVLRPVVIVHDVDVHGDVALVAGFDELFERIGSAVAALDGEEVAGIVAPTVATVEFIDRHKQDAVHAHVLEMIELVDGIEQSGRLAIGRIRIVKGARVQLVDDQIVEAGGRLPFSGGAPVEGGGVVDDAVAVGSRDLARPRIFTAEFAVDQVEVFVAGFGLADVDRPVAGVAVLAHGMAAAIPVVERADDRDALGIRRPDAEGRALHAAAG